MSRIRRPAEVAETLEVSWWWPQSDPERRSPSLECRSRTQQTSWQSGQTRKCLQKSRRESQEIKRAVIVKKNEIKY